jgi:anti-repressor protein
MHPCYILKPRAADVLLSSIDGKGSGPVHCSDRGPRAAAARKTNRSKAMKELIPVQQSEVSGKQVKTVNARDLHAFLESKQDFTTWIKDRIEKYGFAEGIDFAKFHNFVEKGYKPRDEYALTLDMAKELSMVERNARGKQARQYFIECERVALAAVPALQLPDFTDPAAAARAWAEQFEEKKKAIAQGEAARRQIELDRPKVNFANAIAECEKAIRFEQFAKAVYERFRIGRNRLYAILRDLKVLRFNNEPYQEYMERGWFKQVEKTYINPKTEQVVPYFLTLITGKGQVGIFKLLDAHLGREVANA